MAKQITWTRKALEERKAILDFWRKNNQSSDYSRKLNLLIQKAVSLIAAHPQIGRRTDIENVRVKLVRDYLIFYEEMETELFILSILDSRRDPQSTPY